MKIRDTILGFLAGSAILWGAYGLYSKVQETMNRPGYDHYTPLNKFPCGDPSAKGKCGEGDK